MGWIFGILQTLGEGAKRVCQPPKWEVSWVGTYFSAKNLGTLEPCGFHSPEPQVIT